MKDPDFLLQSQTLNILGLASQEAKSVYYVHTYLFWGLHLEACGILVSPTRD